MVLAPVLVVALAGCANPLWPEEGDYAMFDARERLREIETLELAPSPDPVPTVREIAEEAIEGEPELDNPNDPQEEPPERSLTIEQARASALASNLNLRVALVDPAIAAEGVGIEEAAFESAFTLRASFTDSETPTSLTTESSTFESLSLEPGARIPLLTGGTVNLAMPVRRTDQQNSFSTINPSWDTDLSASISQPLLRGAGRRSTTHALRVASYNAGISEAQTKLRVISELAAVDRAYWQLWRARTELEIRREQFDVARVLLARAQRLFDAGTTPEIEVIRARSGLAQRLETIIRAEQGVLARQRELKRIINLDGLDIGGGTLIVPESPPDPIEYEADAEDLARFAVERRAELIELELRLAIDASQIEFDENQKLPLLNAFASYRLNGLDDTFSESFFKGTLDRPYTDEWTVGVDAELPVGNKLAESRYRRSLLTRLQRINTRAAREQTIRQEVFDAVDAIRAGWQRIIAARTSVAASQRALDAEQRQFNLGASTSTDVLDASSRLADERSAEIASIVDYQIAQIELAVSTGTLLGAARVEWEPAADPTLGVSADAGDGGAGQTR